MHKVQVWNLGDAVIDLLPEDNGLLKMCPGGAPANVAVALARLGINSGFIGRVGNDPMGKMVSATLADEGVDISSLSFDQQQRTSTVLVSLDASGEREFTFLVQPSADQFLSTEQLPAFQAEQWLQLSSIALAAPRCRETAIEAAKRCRTAGGWVFFDLNLRAMLWSSPEQMRQQIEAFLPLCDLVKFSEEEALWLSNCEQIEQAVEYLQEQLQVPFILSLGELGSELVYAGKIQRVVAEPVAKVVDTTGAGDAFVGGVLAYLSQFSQWQDQALLLEALARGNKSGGLAVGEKGAMSALPYIHR
ncbi:MULTISPECIES: aminoimidazole riboside kinase [unclassified Agarivorans]|uniref:aminoimidazole riboside kinase n=1 Tax=unclassified Agarivorans TaxID=2636026 RepID=UPI003D7C90D8